MCVVYISWKILTKHGTIFWPRRGKKHHQNLLFSIWGAYFWKIEVRSLISQGFGQGYYARLSFTGQQYYEKAHDKGVMNNSYALHGRVFLHNYSCCQ